MGKTAESGLRHHLNEGQMVQLSNIFELSDLAMLAAGINEMPSDPEAYSRKFRLLANRQLVTRELGTSAMDLSAAEAA